MSAIDRLFLEFSVRKLEQLFSRIRECAGRLSDEQIWLRGSEQENSIGNLLLHLNGNIRQWILTGVADQPDVRVRDREFSARGDISGADLLTRLEDTVREAVAAIQGLTAERLEHKVKLQSYEVTLLEAVYHAVEHFSQHTGQIILMTKAVTGEDLGFYKHLPKASHGQQTP